MLVSKTEAHHRRDAVHTELMSATVIAYGDATAIAEGVRQFLAVLGGELNHLG